MVDEDAGWLGIDLGTQSVRALLVTADGTVLGSGSAPLTGRPPRESRPTSSAPQTRMPKATQSATV
ncbi:hypothetical protein ABZ322_19165 [Streptomyces sp. NPDC006129]|uniref:hypothetical protein n=1 Tax=Streptomyces sp. NPDC006129 TaxID=3155348 RepID=UPI0033AA312E